MPYTDTTKIYAEEPQANIIQLTDDSNTGSINATYVAQAITDGDAIIDAYLLGKIKGWPLSVIPPIISKISTVLAIYNLYLRKFGVGNVRSGQSIPEGLIYRYEDALKMLEKIANGTISITIETIKTSIKTGAKNAVFSDEFLEGY